MNEIKGNLIDLTKEGRFDVITHGCNCFCTMGVGIAVPMKQNFGCDKFPLENPKFRGDINKLGCIDYQSIYIPTETKSGKSKNLLIEFNSFDLIVVNSYTQYKYGRNHEDGDKNPVDYYAIAMCMKKINHTFKGKHIGIPLIGCGLAGGDWGMVKGIIEKELKDMIVTVVYYKEKYKM